MTATSVWMPRVRARMAAGISRSAPPAHRDAQSLSAAGGYQDLMPVAIEPGPSEPVACEPRLLDLCGGVAAGAAATDQRRPDAGIEESLDPDEAGSVAAGVLK